MQPQYRVIPASSPGATPSAPVIHDLFLCPFNVGIGVEVTGTVNYTVQHTFDDIINIGASACVWFNHDDAVLVAATANANSNYAYPVTGSQIVLNSGTGSIKGAFIQAGLRNG